MPKTNQCVYREALERYCHVLGKNVPVSRIMTDGVAVYECANQDFCDKNGGCQNERYAHTQKSL